MDGARAGEAGRCEGAWTAPSGGQVQQGPFAFPDREKKSVQPPEEPALTSIPRRKRLQKAAPEMPWRVVLASAGAPSAYLRMSNTEVGEAISIFWR